MPESQSLFCRDAEIARDRVEFAFIKLRFLQATVARACICMYIAAITRNRLAAFFSLDGSNVSKVIRFAPYEANLSRIGCFFAVALPIIP